ncbi:hypothetical protein ATANTOWER_018218 [Ataeniobius toweri]|uniref:Uncharacterized protein n=1 Tax=Ataeniobius toweri TaxID=208326 RepID=A0ABU7BH02_9TELE|nr:hypothetical protein [Ataeniobius toweri]
MCELPSKNLSNRCSRNPHSFFFVIFWQLAYNDVMHSANNWLGVWTRMLLTHIAACHVCSKVRHGSKQEENVYICKVNEKMLCSPNYRFPGPDLDRSPGFGDPCFIMLT